MYAPTPKAEAFSPAVLEDFALSAEAVNGVRGIRSQRNIAPKETLSLKIKGTSFPNIPLLEKMAGVKVELVEDFAGSQGVGFLVRTREMFVVLEGLVNLQEEIEKSQKELAYLHKFLDGVRAKLSNERFVAHAPEAVIANERKKESDALSKIESLEEKLKSLKKS